MPFPRDAERQPDDVEDSNLDSEAQTSLPRRVLRALGKISNISTWHFDIDHHLNKVIPRPPWRWLPYPVAYFLGYRRHHKLPEIGNIVMVIWAAIGIFCSIILIELASRCIPDMADNGVLIVASFGAAAVLEFYAIESPLAQPRNMVLSQAIASTVGVAVSKLLRTNAGYHGIRWIGGGASCAAAVVVMALTGTVHPPAGATALLAVVDESAAALGWMLIPAMMLGCAVMLAVALLVNNIQRRFPSYWWTPAHLGGTEGDDHGRGPSRRHSHSNDNGNGDNRDWNSGGGEEDRHGTSAGGEKRDVNNEATSEDESLASAAIVIRYGAVDVAPHIFLSPEERNFLELLSNRV